MSETKSKRDIILDLGPCHGCMGCAELCPEIIGWDDETDRPFLKKQEATEEEIQEAVACCPKDCFSLEDA